MIVRKTLEQAKAEGGRFNKEKFDSFTDADIERMIDEVFRSRRSAPGSANSRPPTRCSRPCCASLTACPNQRSAPSISDRGRLDESNGDTACAEPNLRVVPSSNGGAKTNRLRVRRFPTRTLPDHSRSRAGAGESADLSVRRPEQIGPAARRRVALPVVIETQQCRAARWAVAHRFQPQGTAGLRRNRRSRRESIEPVQPKAPPLISSRTVLAPPVPARQDAARVVMRAAGSPERR